MFPILFSIGDYPIYGYGFFIAVGFLLGVLFVRWAAPKKGLPIEPLLDIVFWSVLVGFIGARILFVVTRWSEFKGDLVRALYIWEGGFVFYGAMILGLPLVIGMLKYYKIKLGPALDLYAPALALAHCFGRVGCVSVGCCHGSPLSMDGGVLSRLPSLTIKSSQYVDAQFLGVPLHPVQIYEAAALFVLFLVLTVLLFKEKNSNGKIALIYFMTYSVIRFFLEYLRGDEIRGFVIEPWLSTSQFVSIVIFGIGLVALKFWKNKLWNQ